MGISVIGGSTATGKTLKVAKFTTTGQANTFTLPSGYDATNPLTAEITIVGGGGAAGRGHLTSTNDLGIGGGGGGGGVIKDTIQLTQNVNVVVGRGGASPNWYGYNGVAVGCGSNGEASYISTTTQAANMFINPRFYGLTNDGDSAEFPFEGSYSFENNGGAGGGLPDHAIYTNRWNDYPIHLGPTFSVRASTSYCFSVYLLTNAYSEYQLHLTWLTESGTFISTTSSTTQINSSGSVYYRRHVSGTAPSTAAYCRVALQRTSGTASQLFINAPMFEQGVTSPSTYVDGDTAGYRYAGNPAGSMTFPTSATLFAANGGGGGSGYNYQRNYATIRKGFIGATSGGGGYYYSGLSPDWTVYGGDGGGAGGDAFPLLKIMDSHLGTNTYQTAWGRRSLRNHTGYVEFGEGTYGNYLNVTSSSTQNYTGRPGFGVDGYGAGGHGGYTTSNVTVGNIVFRNETLMYGSINGRANTGKGGDSLMATVSGTTNSYGGAGGSGLVIIKYWE